jgi:GT2 family glycosyltransferase
MHDKVDLSVVIVTWNSADEIYDCLTSSYESLDELNAEFLIIDNASEDGSIPEISKAVEYGIHNITVIENKQNLGYTKACNQGIVISQGRNILLLNPDTQPKPESLAMLFRKLESDEKLGAIAPQLLNEDGSIQYSCRTFPTYWDMFCEFTMLSRLFPESETFAKWKMKYFKHNEDRTVDQPMAAALLVKGDLMRRLNGFDEQFRMFFNDVDLCKRIYESNKQICFYADAKVCHKQGASVNKVKPEMIGIWNDDCLKYFSKHNNKTLMLLILSILLSISGVLRKTYYKLIK